MALRVAHRLGSGWREGLRIARRALRGPDAEPETFDLACGIYLRALGVVFLIAFWSLLVQIGGLVGSEGILPARELFERAGEQLGAERYVKLPSLCWIDAGDGFLRGLCVLGMMGSAALVAGTCALPVLCILWVLYLSLVVAGQDFLSFQWDFLLLEAGFLAMFIAPAALRPRLGVRPTRAGLFLQRWLLFKLMFLSGVTKLLSGDPTWRDLTALHHHYETQPLPSALGYWAHALPGWVQAWSTVGMYVAEIGLPLLVFGPRRLRYAAAGGLVALQLLIAATGSYCFFNLLAVCLCIPLLDDRLLRRLLPARFLPAGGPPEPERIRRRVVLGLAIPVMVASAIVFLREMARTQGRSSLPGAVVWVLDCSERYVLSPGRYVLRVTDPFRTINGYGLFRVMTTRRPEIVIEGSNDGVTWIPYQFTWKAGDPMRRPRYAAPHQPRLDWQMWFAALSPGGNVHWLERLVERLLAGSPNVVGLLDGNPFPGGPPRFIRLLYYQYHFTEPKEKRASGAWWRRELVGQLGPPVSLPPGHRKGQSPGAP